MNQNLTTTDTTHVQTIWDQVCQDLQTSLSPAMYNTWIVGNPLTHFNVVNQTEAQGVITSPTAFHATNLQKNLAPRIAQSIEKITGKTTHLRFEVGNPVISTPKPTTSPTKTPKKVEAITNPTSSAPSEIESPRVEDLFSPKTMQESAVSRAEYLAKKAGLRPDYTFKTFAVSTTNEMAHAAATVVSKNSGLAYNPLFLYGGVGVGKTHLMHAIGNNILYTKDQSNVLYSTGEEFTNEIVSAIQTKKALHFKAKFRSADVLLIDDVQFIAGKNAVQEEFFHTFNAIIKRHGQIVMTSDRPPHEINLLEDRLRSRFEAGLMIDIQEPSFELRTAILLIKSQAINLDISMELAQLIASKVSSARKIEGIITSIRSEVELKHRQISREMIEELLNHETPEMTAKLRVGPDQVFKTVANHYRIKQIVIKGRKRQQNVVRARHVAMYLFKNNLNYSYVEVGRWFSNRDHTSVMHAVNKITKHLKTDLELQQEVAAIQTSLAAVSR